MAAAAVLSARFVVLAGSLISGLDQGAVHRIRLQGDGPAKRLRRQVQPEPEHQHGSRQRHDRAQAIQALTAWQSIEALAREDHREPDASHDGRHAEPERDDEHEAERGSPCGDRPKQDEQRADRWDKAASEAQDEQAPPGDGRPGGGQVRVADPAVAVLGSIGGLVLMLPAVRVLVLPGMRM